MNTYDKKKKFGKKKVCRFCVNKELQLNYKNIDMFRSFISDVGKIEPARITGNCSKHQKRIASEIKLARQMALIPYVIE